MDSEGGEHNNGDGKKRDFRFILARDNLLSKREEEVTGGSLFGGFKFFTIRAQKPIEDEGKHSKNVDELISSLSRSARGFAKGDAAELASILLYTSSELAARILSMLDDPHDALLSYLQALDSRMRAIIAARKGD